MRCGASGLLAVLGLLACVPAQAQENRLHVMIPTRQLLREKRHDEALAGLVQAAEKAQDAEDQAYYLGEAIGIARHSLKDPARALALAQQIRDPAHSQNQQLALLAADGSWDAIAGRFGAADLAAWPDICRQQAYLNRAQAWLKLGRHEQAEADLLQAIEAPGDKSTRGRACQLLGSFYRTVRKDPDRALAVYERALALTDAGYAWRNECFLDRTAILLEQERFEEAEKAFETIDFRGFSTDYWRNAFYQAHATVLERQGKAGSAARQLMQALRLGGLSEGARQQTQARLDRLIEGLWEQAPPVQP